MRHVSFSELCNRHFSRLYERDDVGTALQPVGGRAGPPWLHDLETQLAEDFSYLSVNSVYLENCVLEEGLLGGICEDDAHFIVKPTENEARYLWAPEIGGEQTQENCFS